MHVFSRVLRNSTPRYVGPSVGQLVPFLLFWCFWAYGSCPDALVTFSGAAPAHPHATRVAVYLALLKNKTRKSFIEIFFPPFLVEFERVAEVFLSGRCLLNDDNDDQGVHRQIIRTLTRMIQ